MPASAAFVASSNPVAVASAIEGLGIGSDETALVFVASGNPPPLPALVDELRSLGISFFGGLFPAVINGHQKHDAGVLAVRIPKLGEPKLIRELDRAPVSIPNFLLDLPAPGSKPTALVLVDGIAANISAFLEGIYHQLGSRVGYWGGGAGSLTFEPTPCVFTADGVAANAAVVAFCPLPARLGVRHGWTELAGPLVATRTEKNVIHELNWKNALAVYRGIVEPDIGRVITAENFFDSAKGHPFGIHRDGEEVVVRDPVGVTSKGSLTCVGEVPENAVLVVLKGESGDLVNAAAQAARDACPAAGVSVRHSLIADCISRVLYLEERFPEELAAIEEALRGGPTPVGVLTLGEIASRGEGYLEFYNKTAVVAVLHDPV